MVATEIEAQIQRRSCSFILLSSEKKSEDFVGVYFTQETLPAAETCGGNLR